VESTERSVEREHAERLRFAVCEFEQFELLEPFERFERALVPTREFQPA
jgi:hypothetical protein